MSRPVRLLTPATPQAVTFDDGFWKPRRETNRTVTLDTSYRHLKKAGNLEAYQWDWWTKKGKRPPWKIWVGDLPKWIEACAYSLATRPDAALRRKVRGAVDAIAKGQKPDGYLYANRIARDWRYRNLAEWHELYDLGHMIEGAVALAECTGDESLLEVVNKAVACVDHHFGTGRGKIRGSDGHPEIELALMRLYRRTHNPRHLALARFFVDVRGRDPKYYDREEAFCRKAGIPRWGWLRQNPKQAQAHKPVREQDTAEGHAVRALYLFSRAVDVAAETGDTALLDACRRVWRNLTRRRMYVTGGAGSNPQAEAFTCDFDLPNEVAYSETCASIALAFFAHRMLQVEPAGEYADAMERALYNTIPAGVSLDGKSFFYSNRLAVHPAALKNESGHRKASRQEWFGCSCCPPNVARLFASLGAYAASTGPDSLWIHLYAAGSMNVTVGGVPVSVQADTQYPWDGRIRMTVAPERPAAFTLALRIPGWARSFTLAVNGKALRLKPERGYARIKREWERGDRIELRLPMPIERLEAHPSVRENAGLVALQRGPVVYALEEIDNGADLAALALPDQAPVRVRWNAELNAPVLKASGVRASLEGWNDNLYRPAHRQVRKATLTAVPYCLWNNRGEGEMRVWMRRA